MVDIGENKIILDLCGGTGAWSKPYKDAGYDVRLVTRPNHDVCTFIPPDNVYGILAAPPCEQFSIARTNARTPRDLCQGMREVRACMDIIWRVQEKQQDTRHKYTSLTFWALENPYYGLLKRFLGKPAFVFNPYDFGDDYKKNTALWGYFNEPVKTPIVSIKPKFDRLRSHEIHGEFFGKLDRKTRRAITPTGFAKAFFKANQ